MPCRPIAPCGCSARTTSSRRWWRKRSRPMAHRSMPPDCARRAPCTRRRDEALSPPCAIRDNPDSVVIYVSASSEAAANALARKLPHYGKYSWLVFAGDEATNEATGEWPVGDTPLARNLTPQGRPIKLAPRKALAEVKPQFDIARMKADIEWLASPEREGRGAGSRGLDAAADYIAQRFERLGLSPLTPGARGDDRYFQPFTHDGRKRRAVGGEERDRRAAGHQPGPERAGIDRIRALRSSRVWLAGCARRRQRAIASGRRRQRIGRRRDAGTGAADGGSRSPNAASSLRHSPARRRVSLGARHYVRTAQAPDAPFALSGHHRRLEPRHRGASRRRQGYDLRYRLGARIAVHLHGGGCDDGRAGANVSRRTSMHRTMRRLSRPECRPCSCLLPSRPITIARRTRPTRSTMPGSARLRPILKEAVDYLAARTEPLNFSGDVAGSAVARPGGAKRDPPGCHRHRARHDRPGRRRTSRQRAAGIGSRKCRAQTR